MSDVTNFLGTPSSASKKIIGTNNDLLELITESYANAMTLQSNGVNVSKQLEILDKIDLEKLNSSDVKEFKKIRSILSKVLGDLNFKNKTLHQSKSPKGGIGVLIFLVVISAVFFYFVIPASFFIPDESQSIPNSSQINNATQGITNDSLDFQIVLIPAYVYVWGIMGALSYLFWACITHIANKDFDNYYIPWFFLRIPLGAIMAAAIYFVVISGFATLGDSIATDSREPFVVLAFVSGFSIRYSLNMMDRVTSAILPHRQDVKEETIPSKEKES